MTVKVWARINQKFNISGLDDYDRCFNKEWFKAYPHPITYVYNSRGFRDNEWPDDLQNAIWCIGDSFTAGIGAPIEHTWPYLLSAATGIRTINIGMDGASNDWIARMSSAIATISPRTIVHQWSYTHRRENIRYAKTTEAQDIDNFITAVKRTQGTNVIHSMIPKFEPVDAKGQLLREYDLAKNALRELGFDNVVYDNEQLDYARDYHHYDILTAKKYVENYLKLL